MIIIHEGGHWHYTLACITELTDFERIELTITLFNPACRPIPMKASIHNTFSKDELFRGYRALSDEQRHKVGNKCTLKSLNITWTPDIGNAGNFAEYRGWGLTRNPKRVHLGFRSFSREGSTGILFLFSVHAQRSWLFAPYVDELPRCFREKGVCQFHPPAKTADLLPPLPKATCLRGNTATDGPPILIRCRRCWLGGAVRRTTRIRRSLFRYADNTQFRRKYVHSLNMLTGR